MVFVLAVLSHSLFFSVFKTPSLGMPKATGMLLLLLLIALIAVRLLLLHCFAHFLKSILPAHPSRTVRFVRRCVLSLIRRVPLTTTTTELQPNNRSATPSSGPSPNIHNHHDHAGNNCRNPPAPQAGSFEPHGKWSCRVAPAEPQGRRSPTTSTSSFGSSTNPARSP